MYDYSVLIQSCRGREAEEAAQGIDIGAMILGRLSPRLERDFFPKFQELGWQFSKPLKSIKSSDEFDVYHHRFVTAFRETIKARSGTIISYGEAQQPINVFLRDYLENVHLLGPAEAERLRPFLHVTLDGVMIYYFQSFFRDDYLQHIGPTREACGYFDTSRLTSFHHQDISQSQLTQLLFIGKETYYAWQNWFRQIFPDRPVLLEATWSIARKTLFAGGVYWGSPQPAKENSLRDKLSRFLNSGPAENG